MIQGLSHLTFIVRDLDRMEDILTTILDARKVYDSGDRTFSLGKERFFLLGQGDQPIWIAIMEGDPPPARTYDHVAFRIPDSSHDAYLSRIVSMGLDIREGRARVAGEGRSIYFHDDDNHMFELHSATLPERLARYAQGPSLSAGAAQESAS